MARGPLIAITMRLEMPTDRFYLARDYAEAIVGAGGVTFQIPLIPDDGYLNSLMEQADGLLLPGCDSDPDPALYGADPHPKLGAVVAEKDATDLICIAAAERLELPIMGICFGMQILNVSRGGSLIQDIESQVPNAIKHQQGSPRERKSHKIRFDGDSLIAKSAVGLDGEMFVNSHHHQAVDTLGRDLKATARTSDGVIEAMEDATGKPVSAVQWHPEVDWQNDAVSQKIFANFIQTCTRSGG